MLLHKHDAHIAPREAMTSRTHVQGSCAGQQSRRGGVTPTPTTMPHDSCATDKALMNRYVMQVLCGNAAQRVPHR